MPQILEKPLEPCSGMKPLIVSSPQAKSFWLMLNGKNVVFGTGSVPGQQIRLITKVPDACQGKVQHIGVANWEEPAFINPLAITQPPELGFISARLINKHITSTTLPFRPRIRVDPKFTILREVGHFSYHYLPDNLPPTTQLVSSKSEFCFYLLGPKDQMCPVTFETGITPDSVLVTSTAQKGHNTYAPLHGNQATLQLIQPGIPLGKAAIRPAEALDVYTNFIEDGIKIRIEHFSPSRIAGKYLACDPHVLKIQSLLALNLMIASREILRDGKWYTALQKQFGPEARVSLMGFETCNPLHGDFPAHWHFATRTVVDHSYDRTPHIYFTDSGHMSSFHAGTPDHKEFDLPFMGKLVISNDGNISWVIEGTTYVLCPTKTAPICVQIIKNGADFGTVACSDDTLQGVMTLQLNIQGRRWTEITYYDPYLGQGASGGAGCSETKIFS